MSSKDCLDYQDDVAYDIACNPLSHKENRSDQVVMVITINYYNSRSFNIA